MPMLFCLFLFVLPSHLLWPCCLPFRRLLFLGVAASAPDSSFFGFFSTTFLSSFLGAVFGGASPISPAIAEKPPSLTAVRPPKTQTANAKETQRIDFMVANQDKISKCMGISERPA